MNQSATTEHMDRYLVDGPLWLGISRGIAGFFGLVCLLDAFRALVIQQAGADFGWIDLSPCPEPAARGLMAFIGVTLLLFCVTHRLPRMIQPAAIIGVMSLVALAVANAISIHRSIGQGELADGIPMPAHVVTLLMPVVFGLVRGRQYGPLRFPTGGAMLLLSLVATGFGFSVGYVSSLSKFQRPTAADSIVVMHPRAESSSESPQVAAVQQLIEGGHAGRVLVLQRAESAVPPIDLTAFRTVLPAETDVRAVTISSEADLIQVLGEPGTSALMFVGDQRDAPRVRLVAQRLAGRISFVSATREELDESVVDDIRTLWLAWLTPLRQQFTDAKLAAAN